MIAHDFFMLILCKFDTKMKKFSLHALYKFVSNNSVENLVK